VPQRIAACGIWEDVVSEEEFDNPKGNHSGQVLVSVCGLRRNKTSKLRQRGPRPVRGVDL
jgi:hypothetical protein